MDAEGAVEAGRNDAMVASPLLLGASTRNHLGRSQNGTHPYPHGAIRDFRLHNPRSATPNCSSTPPSRAT